MPPGAERLLWLTGFSGSAGLAIVLADKAALFVDGRYTLQAPAQVDGSASSPSSTSSTSRRRPGSKRTSARAAALGYDPWLHTPESVERLAKACRAAGGELVAVETNPIDAIWTDRPGPPLAPIRAHPERLAGERASAKLKRVGEALKGADGPAGQRRPFRRLAVQHPRRRRRPYAAAARLRLCAARGPADFVRRRAEADGRRSARGSAASPTIAPPEALVPFVAARGAAGARVVFDAATAPARLTQALEAAGGKAIVKADPIARMKAVKNAVELAGTRAAHIRDGAALSRFLAWFDAEAPKGGLTEIDAAAALETFRRETGALKDVSFPTIAAAGPHAAIAHYRVSEASNLKIGRGLFLIDSGGQYEDGTTDVTRTIGVGRPTAELRDRFTRVLKGHIAIARAIFPRGTTGGQLDTLAREALWRAGLDFDHGTGHGVGVYLSVHEGPQRLSKTDSTALEPGMILSNEPGYYAAGRFGIRIENLVVVARASRSPAPTGRRSASRRSRSRRSISGWSKRS